ncbi:hypothetical protein AgCh_021773 [Apium graveolens]
MQKEREMKGIKRKSMSMGGGSALGSFPARFNQGAVSLPGKSTGFKKPMSVNLSQSGQKSGRSYSNQSRPPLPACNTCGRMHNGECKGKPVICFKCGREAASGASRAASNKPPTARTFNMTVQDAMKDSDVIAGTLSLNLISANVLFDSGATKSFISKDFAHKLRLKAEPLIEPLQVEIANHEIIPVNQIHPAYYKGKKVKLNIPGKKEVIIRGKRQTQKFLTMAQANKMLQKGNEAYLAYVVDMQKEVPNLQDIPVVNKFEDVFPQDLPGLPPDRVIEFAIEVAPGTTPVSKAPYRLAPL